MSRYIHYLGLSSLLFFIVEIQPNKDILIPQSRRILSSWALTFAWICFRDIIIYFIESGFVFSAPFMPLYFVKSSRNWLASPFTLIQSSLYYIKSMVPLHDLIFWRLSGLAPFRFPVHFIESCFSVEFLIFCPFIWLSLALHCLLLYFSFSFRFLCPSLLMIWPMAQHHLLFHVASLTFLLKAFFVSLWFFKRLSTRSANWYDALHITVPYVISLVPHLPSLVLSFPRLWSSVGHPLLLLISHILVFHCVPFRSKHRIMWWLCLPTLRIKCSFILILRQSLNLEKKMELLFMIVTCRILLAHLVRLFFFRLTF